MIERTLLVSSLVNEKWKHKTDCNAFCQRMLIALYVPKMQINYHSSILYVADTELFKFLLKHALTHNSREG